MGRGRRSSNQNQDAPASNRRTTVSINERQLAEYERAVMPLATRFSAAAIGRTTQEDQNQARARAVRKLPQDTQRKLIEVAQGCTAIVEELGRGVSCPVCDAPAGSPCVTAEKKERKIVHPDRLALAKSECADIRRMGEVDKAERLGARAREVFIFSHTGYVMQTVRKHVGAFESESSEDALELLRQEAYLGLNDAVNLFQLHWADEDGTVSETEQSPADQAAVRAADSIKKNRVRANPLTFSAGRIRHRVSEAKELGPVVTAKSRAFDERQQVDAAVKAIQNRGATVTVAEITEKTGVPLVRAAQLLRTLTPKARLDAPLSSGGEEGNDTLGSVIADQAPGTEGKVLAEAEREAVREAANKLKPFQRRVIEAHFNLADGEEVEQKDLYDGVYVDPASGAAFSSEGTVISDRTKRGLTVTRTSQKELNRRFKDGELVFEAGTPESFELALLKKRSQTPEQAQPDQDALLRRVITRETGVPMTSGQIQDAKDQALYELSQLDELQSLRPRYRGNHELENSLRARQMVRRALVMLGELPSDDAADGVKAGRAARDGSHNRGPLGQKAQEFGWLDSSNGRVLWGKVREDIRKRKGANARARRDARLESSEELASLMSTV